MKKFQTFDIQICDREKVLYYLKWIKNYGFIEVSKEVYENAQSVTTKK